MFKKKKSVEDITVERLYNYYQGFIEDNNIPYTRSIYLFNNGVFNTNNYNSGVDIPLREYFKKLEQSAKINSHYYYNDSDVLNLSVSVNKFNDRIVVIVYISIFNSEKQNNDVFIFNIEYMEYSKHIDILNCNNIPCSESDFVFLLNILQKHGLYLNKFGNIKKGYAFDYDKTYNYQ